MKWIRWFNSLSILCAVFVTIGLVSLLIGFGLLDLGIQTFGVTLALIGLVIYIILIAYLKFKHIPQCSEYNPWLSVNRS